MDSIGRQADKPLEKLSKPYFSSSGQSILVAVPLRCRCARKAVPARHVLFQERPTQGHKCRGPGPAREGVNKVAESMAPQRALQLFGLDQKGPL